MRHVPAPHCVLRGTSAVRALRTLLAVALTGVLVAAAGAPADALPTVDTMTAQTMTSQTTTSQTTTSQTPADRAMPAGRGCSIVAKRWEGVPRFWTTDTHCYRSPWYAGSHRVMIKFGCNKSPWYPKVKACGYRGGVHHGVDIDMPVGTAIRTAVSGRVYVRPSTMGSAYGRHGVLIRSGGKDYVLGHLSKLKVRNGQRVKAGQLIGYSGMSGVEHDDGPHLHFEVRPAGGSYRSAVNPWRHARLTVA